MTYFSVTFAMILAMIALILWGLVLPMIGLLKAMNEAASGLMRLSKRMLKWI